MSTTLNGNEFRELRLQHHCDWRKNLIVTLHRRVTVS